MTRRRNRPASRAQVEAAASLKRWETWVDELARHALDQFEYEALLLHRSMMDEELILAGSDNLDRVCDEIDARFEELTIDDPGSPFLPGGSRQTVPDSQKAGGWWSRVPANPDHRAYTFGES